MEKEEKSLGGTLGEGEASKKENDQPFEVGQENVQTITNSNDAARKREEYIAQKINEMAQTPVNVEVQDKKICGAVYSWVNKPTKEAKKYLDKGYTKYRYIGRKLGQAAVPYDTGLDYLKSKYPDEDPKHLEEEYTLGYGEIDFDPDFRNYFTKNKKP